MVIHTIPDELACLGKAHNVGALQVIDIHDDCMALHPRAVIPVLDHKGAPLTGSLRQYGGAGALLALGQVFQFQDLIPAVQCHDGIQIGTASGSDASRLCQLLRKIPFQQRQIQVAFGQDFLPGLGECLGKMTFVALDPQGDFIPGLPAILDAPLIGVGRSDLYAQKFIHFLLLNS